MVLVLLTIKGKEILLAQLADCYKTSLRRTLRGLSMTWQKDSNETATLLEKNVF